MIATPTGSGVHVFKMDFATDNFLHAEKGKGDRSLAIANLGNTVALNNLLSTFSGTHHATHRCWCAEAFLKSYSIIPQTPSSAVR